MKNIVGKRKVELEWIPNHSLGPVVIGASVEGYIENFLLVKDDAGDETGWETYIFPNFETYLDVEDGKVVSITAYSEFFYKGQNIIGINLIRLGQLLGVKADEVGEPVVHDDGDVRQSYEYFDLGLQVWVSNGHVTSVSCMCYGSRVVDQE